MKKNLTKILDIVAIILFIAFIIILVIDYINYDSLINSAPFYAFIIIRSIELLLPSIIIGALSMIIKKKKWHSFMEYR